MWKYWKADILRAIVLALVIAVLGVLINWLRTPVFNAMASGGRISHARARQVVGVSLVDDWRHKGWPEVALDGDGNGSANGTGQPEADYQVQVIPIDVFRAKEMFDEGDCIFYDAREQEYYEESHIAGAYNWPADYFDMYFERYEDSITHDDCIVVYCIGGTCDESYHLGISLSSEGFRNVYLFEGGMEIWEFSGYPINEGPEP